MKNKGFTLVELLVVVAVVAILVAIGLPNLLEAQMRAKVARTMADQRVVSTALESYLVDSNHYPAAGRVAIENARWRLKPVNWLAQLTTPIAYLTSDQYLDHKVWTPSGRLYTKNLNRGWADYANLQQILEVDMLNGVEVRNSPLGIYAPIHQWVLQSPDIATGTQLPNFPIARNMGVYDPTNGTISSGSICRTHEGVAPFTQP